VLCSAESGLRLPSQDGEPHAHQSVRQYANRIARQWCTSCTGWLLVGLSQSTSVLLCLLAASKHKLDQKLVRHRSKRSANHDDRPDLRNGNLRLVEPKRPRVVYHRTAVGLRPLGYTSNGW